ncbi:hypothetical protein RchiOBHm_Chr7g0184941 [Rosa chinensis]|uniref:Uncharacterized protein n=1 Tax=Rosa chinensis TaxID=74649 RepID=A0A2P6P3L5_ROSCH|nr:hypothetical protein RchiOBHm_Chr7g0184941 [Rosa chinensis]
MKRGAKSSRRLYYDDAPNEKNQRQHSPANSSSAALPNPPHIDARDMLRILVPTLPTSQERIEQAIDVARREHARPRPNNCVFQFGTPPRAASNIPRTGPHLTPSAHLQLKTDSNSGETEIISTAHYHGDQYAESEGEVCSMTSKKAGTTIDEGRVKEEASERDWYEKDGWSW